MRTESKLKLLGTLMVAAALLLPAGPAGACDCGTLPTLKSAFEFAAFGMGKNDITMSGSAFADNGNIGMAGGNAAKVIMSGGATIDGYIHHHLGTSVSLWSPAAAGSGTAVRDMSQQKQDVLDFSAALAAFASTQFYPGINNTLTIKGNGCINIIEVKGDIAVSGTKVLTLNGGPDDYFVFNVYDGSANFSGTGSIVLTGGLESHHVVFNLLKAGADAVLSGDGLANATFVTVNGKAVVSGAGSSLGAFYADGLSLSGGGSFEGRPFQCDCTTIDPALLGTNVQRPAAAANRGAGNSHFFLASFNFEAEEGKLEALRLDTAGDIFDRNGLPAVDPATNLFEAGRTPYWEAGTELLSNLSRKIYTTKPGPVRTDFDTALTVADLDITAPDLLLFPNYPASGVDTLLEGRDAVVRYIHGKDAFDEDGDLDFTDMRSWTLGPILHSNVLYLGRPMSALSFEDGYSGFFNKYEKRDRVVYAGGGSDALLHAFDAGSWFDPQDPVLFDPGSGAELFAYLPGLLLKDAKRGVYDDDTVQFFVDGNITASDAWLGTMPLAGGTKLEKDWTTVVVASMRGGGRGYLALDVTDPSAGAVQNHGPYPKPLWEFTHAKLGYSWSTPVITRVKLRGPLSMDDYCGMDDGEAPCREQWVAIFAGGYENNGDPNHSSYEPDPNSATWSDRSKAIYMVALDTGQLLASVEFDKTGATGPSEMKYSMPSAPAVLDLDGDGFADVVYEPDLGGQVFKWDISAVGEDTADPDTLIDNWPAGLFFKVDPEDMGSGVFHYRSMFFPPSAALVDGLLTLSFGTGEREDLLYEGDAAKDENNRFYVVSDPEPTGPLAFFLSGGAPRPAVTEADLSDITILATDPDPSDRGFFFVGSDGEKFIADVIIFANHVITVSSNDTRCCSPPERSPGLRPNSWSSRSRSAISSARLRRWCSETPWSLRAKVRFSPTVICG